MKQVLLITIFLSLYTSPVFAGELSEGWKRSVPAAIERCDQYDRQFLSAGWDTFQSPTFLKAIAIVESLCKPDAVSSANAQGLMQLKKVAQKDTGIEGDLKDPHVSIRVGAAYFAMLKDRYDYGFMEELAVAYNQGPTGGRKIVEQDRVFDHAYVKKLSYVLKHIDLVM